MTFDWLTATVAVAIVGAVIAATNLGLGLYKQTRENKSGRAKFGYELIDAMIREEEVLALLNYIDGPGAPMDNLELALQAPEEKIGNKEATLINHFDSLLLHLDRAENEIASDLTSIEVIEMPLGYYVRILATKKKALKEYISKIGYVRAESFLKRFASWSAAQPVDSQKSP